MFDGSPEQDAQLGGPGYDDGDGRRCLYTHPHYAIQAVIARRGGAKQLKIDEQINLSR